MNNNRTTSNIPKAPPVSVEADNTDDNNYQKQTVSTKHSNKDDKEHLFEKGDRVAIINVTDAKLNGQHGVIALEGGKLTIEKKSRNGKVVGGYNYSIHLDRLNPVGIQLSPENIRYVLPPKTTFNVAPVINGALPAPSGPLLLNTIHLFRWYIANKYFQDPDVNQLQDAMRLSAAKKLKYNNFMISNWHSNNTATTNNDNQSKSTTINNNVYIDLFQFVYKSNPSMIHPTQKSFLVQSMANARAMKCWYTGFQRDLWFVGDDPTNGKYVVPDCNLSAVFCITALVPSPTAAAATSNTQKQQQPQQLTLTNTSLSIHKTPFKVPNVTVLPWFGRLLYEVAADSTSGPPEKASDTFAVQLQAVVLKAIQDKTVINWFTELDEIQEKIVVQQQQYATEANKKTGDSQNTDISQTTIAYN